MPSSNLPPFLLSHTPWEGEVSPIWPASTFTLKRNLGKFPFPGKMNDSQFQQTFEILKSSLLSCSALKNPIVLRANELNALDKEFLFEHYLCKEAFQNTLPGQGFVIVDDSHLLALLNIEDHITFQIVDCKNDLDSTWNTLVKILEALQRSLDFAYMDKFGYLTADPAYCGTALIVSAFLHVPALIKRGQLEDTLIKQKEEELVAAGLEGNLQELTGDFLILSNKYTLGLSEDNILHSLYMCAMKLTVAEKTERNQIKEQDDSKIKDEISRAFGLLFHSYQLQTKETLDALSLLKLGVSLGWVLGISDQKINELMFSSRRGHLATLLQLPPNALEDIPKNGLPSSTKP